MNKWGNKKNFVDYRSVKKVELDGKTFGSKAEAQGYLYLKALEQNGEVINIRTQVRIQLLPGSRKERVDYYVDFVVYDLAAKEDQYIEIKGFETDKWKMKLKLWRHFGPGKLKVYKVGWNTLGLHEEVIPNGGSFLCSRCLESSILTQAPLTKT